MKKTFVTNALVSLLALSASIVAHAEYSPRDFVKHAPASTFYTDDEMSEEEKAALIRGGFQKKGSFSCDSWGIAEETPRSLVLKYCNDSAVTVHTFPDKKGSAVIAVQSERGNGRAITLSFFSASPTKTGVIPLSSPEVEALGIIPLNENDFVKAPDKFKTDDVAPALLTLEGDGTIQARVETWMNPRWAVKQPAFEIAFVWDGERFQKRVTPSPYP